MELTKWVDQNKQAMVETLQQAVRIKSVREDAKPGKPFGDGPAKCLDFMLKKAADMGFTTENVDNYMGWCEYGEGPQMVAVLGHLDVVPEGDGWDRDPYSGDCDGTNVYGRGTMDDKGPTTAALYALKALKDSGVPLKRRIRILFGTNEETGSADMKHYLEKGGEIPVCGFTPDGEYPVINGEKGIINVTFSKKYTQSGPVVLKSLKGGSAFNVVPALAEAIVACAPAEATRLLEEVVKPEPKVQWEVVPEGLKVVAQGGTGPCGPSGTGRKRCRPAVQGPDPAALQRGSERDAGFPGRQDRSGGPRGIPGHLPGGCRFRETFL